MSKVTVDLADLGVVDRPDGLGVAPLDQPDRDVTIGAGRYRRCTRVRAASR